VLPWRLEKRHAEARPSPLAAAGLALGLAALAGSVLFAALGVNPFTAWAVMFKGALGSGYAASEVLVRSAPLVFTGLAVALAATMLLWNIGCEGQLVWGGIFAAGVALNLGPALPAWLVLPLMLLAGALGGALWALIPAGLKARYGVSEILTTLLLNYVAIIYMEHLFYGPWRDPAGYGFPGTAMFAEAARLPRLFGTRIHLGLPLALILAGVQYAMLQRSAWGYKVRVMGMGPQAARYAGMNPARQTLLVLGLSGALAGLAGTAEVAGIHYRLQVGLAVGYGYDGIIVAWLARLNPLLVPATAVLLGGLIVGGEQLQSVLGLPSSISLILEAALLFGLLAGEALGRYRLVRILPGPRTPEGEGT
jgi:simple sugar transport system permease protein